MSAIPCFSPHQPPASPALGLPVAGLDAPGSTPDGPASDQIVLIVDDDVALRSTAAMMLECQGFKTVVAGNGLEAIQQLERNPQISAVLLDLLMPVMDGEETFRQLRNFWASIPVVLISGFDLGDVALRFGESLPDGYLQKPFSLAKLTSVISGVLH